MMSHLGFSNEVIGCSSFAQKLVGLNLNHKILIPKSGIFQGQPAGHLLSEKKT